MINFIGKVNGGGKHMGNAHGLAKHTAGYQAAPSDHQQAIKLAPKLRNQMVDELIDICPTQYLSF